MVSLVQQLIFDAICSLSSGLGMYPACRTVAPHVGDDAVTSGKVDFLNFVFRVHFRVEYGPLPWIGPTRVNDLTCSVLLHSSKCQHRLVIVYIHDIYYWVSSAVFVGVEV